MSIEIVLLGLLGGLVIAAPKQHGTPIRCRVFGHKQHFEYDFGPWGNTDTTIVRTHVTCERRRCRWEHH